MKVFIATPSFDGKVNIQYVHSLIETLGLLSALGIDAVTSFMGHCAYLQKVRNTLADDFLKSDCTDLFFIDADMGWDAKAVPRMLTRPYEFIGAAYPFKQETEDYPVNIKSDADGRPLVDPATGCIAADMVPSGFWRLRRSVVEKIAAVSDSYLENGRRITDLFPTPVIGDEWIGEDVYFCRRWIEQCGQIWLEPNIDFVHVGNKDHKGNYHEFLLRQPGGSKQGEAA